MYRVQWEGSDRKLETLVYTKRHVIVAQLVSTYKTIPLPYVTLHRLAGVAVQGSAPGSPLKTLLILCKCARACVCLCQYHFSSKGAQSRTFCCLKTRCLTLQAAAFWGQPLLRGSCASLPTLS